MNKILVWDWPQRIGHWVLVLAIALAWLTAERESWLRVHAVAGGVACGVAAFRVLWGVLGSHYARFSQFIHGPQAVLAYLRGLLRGQPTHWLGHNPAGGWAILALLTLILATTSSGWATYNELAGHWLEELHEGLAEALLALIGVHVAAVVLSSHLHRENLVRAMLDGRKSGPEAAGIGSPHPLVLPLLLALAVAGGYWAQL